ncbi:HEAT repeat domain-containing protein, partial [bacterium]|nr:HEAT repeat domain-containing protein [bacterium]
RDGRTLYVRNYMPHLSYNQPSYYSDLGEIRHDIRRVAAEGKLDAAQRAYAGPRRPIEELYDTQADPHQVRNLAASPEHQPVLDRLRQALRQWIADTRDVGFLPEADAALRCAGTTPYALARDKGRYPQQRIVAAADLVGRGPAAVPRQTELLGDPDAAVRYWATVGLHAAGGAARPAAKALRRALRDPSACVRIEAAAALAGLGHAAEALALLQEELAKPNSDARVRAARALELLGPAARPALPAMRAALAAARKQKGQHAMYVRFSLDQALKTLETK